MQLGTLEVVELRTVWAHEALHFTKWLASPDNIQQLCAELDIEIEDIKVEESSGRYNADIVGIESTTKKKVIIENQLETTDHKHLGQIITYASGLDANIIIWIAKDYNDEHKAAIDWLNRNLTSDVKFFLIQIELWKIGNSLPAPKFNIVSQPNDWIKTIESATRIEKGSPSNLKLQNQQFWTQFKDFLKEAKSTLSTTRSAKPRHYYNFKISSSKAHLSMSVLSKQKQIVCSLVIHNDKSLYDKIEQHKDEIEQQLGSELIWENDPSIARAQVLKTMDANPTDETNWPHYFQWMKDNGEQFQVLFKRYLQ